MPNRIPLAAGIVGGSYMAVICKPEGTNTICATACPEWAVEITARSKTHTYLKHANGDLALPNDISIDLIALKENEGINKVV